MRLLCQQKSKQYYWLSPVCFYGWYCNLLRVYQWRCE